MENEDKQTKIPGSSTYEGQSPISGAMPIVGSILAFAVLGGLAILTRGSPAVKKGVMQAALHQLRGAKPS